MMISKFQIKHKLKSKNGQTSCLGDPLPSTRPCNPLLGALPLLGWAWLHVTFLNKSSTHHHITSSLRPEEATRDHNHINMLAVQDGVPPEDRHEIGKQCEAISAAMPGQLEELLRRMNQYSYSEEGKVTCAIADATMGPAVDVARKMGVRSAAMWTASAAMMAVREGAPELVDNQVLDANGQLFRKKNHFMSARCLLFSSLLLSKVISIITSY